MKKVKFLTLIASIATLGFFTTSCSPTEDTAPVITPSANSTISGSTIYEGDVVFLEYTITSENKLASVEITDQTSKTIKAFTISDSPLYACEITGLTAGTYTLNVVAIDKKDLKSTSSITITVVAAPALKTWDNVILGAQSATEGSYFDIATGNVLGQTAAETTGTTVSYSYASIGATTPVATLIAPNVRISEGDLSKTSAGAEKCYFKKSTLTFATATKTDVAALTVSATDAQKITVAKGDVIEFLTASGKKGLISVVDLTDGVSGKIIIDVKVQ